MTLLAKAARTFDDWVLGPPYRSSFIPWPWHLAFLALCLLSAVSIVVSSGWPFGALVTLVLGLVLARDARRAYIKKQPDRRRDGRAQAEPELR